MAWTPAAFHGFAFASGQRPVVMMKADSSVFFAMFSPAQGHPIRRLSADTLVMIDEGTDGWLHVFVRWRKPTGNGRKR